MKRFYCRFKKDSNDGYNFRIGILDHEAELDPFWLNLYCYPAKYWFANPEVGWPGESVIFSAMLNHIQLVVDMWGLRAFSYHNGNMGMIVNKRWLLSRLFTTSQRRRGLTSTEESATLRA
jgi:hypothetical protein